MVLSPNHNRKRPAFEDDYGCNSTCFPASDRNYETVENSGKRCAAQILMTDQQQGPVTIPRRPGIRSDVALRAPVDESSPIEAWHRDLCTGVEVALDGEHVTLTVDTDLHCLEISEHEALYPLAELKSCDEMHAETMFDAPLQLSVHFAGGMGELVFDFDCVAQRAGFAGALTRLSIEARRATGATLHDNNGNEDTDDDEEPLLGDRIEKPAKPPHSGALTATDEVVGYGEPDGGPW